MTDSQLVRVQPGDARWEAALNACCAGLSLNSRRAYTSRVTRFLAWWAPQQRPLDRRAVEDYLMLGPEPSTAKYNQTLAGIKRLAFQAASHGWLDWDTQQRIKSIPSKTARGVRSGVWLSKQQASEMIAAIDRGTMAGMRDLTVISLLVGCGLRRSEVCAVTFSEHLRTIEDRLHIVNLKGKGNRLRTIRVPDWVAEIIREWSAKSGLTEGYVVRSIRAEGAIGERLSPSAIRDIVIERSSKRCAPHDLRRTFAKLARKGGAPLEVLQRTLGHASLTTTEKYVNSGEEANAGDYLQL